MADAVARSEARKRRILENAEKRINRLYSRQRAEHEINGMIIYTITYILLNSIELVKC